MTTITNISLSRRRFLGGSAASAGVFMLGLHLPLGRAALADDVDGDMNAYIGIADDGTVTIRNPYIEMGQGTYTSIPMLIAEELDIGMDIIRVEQAPPGEAYRLLYDGSRRFTGGSFSVRSAFKPLRTAGATARKMLMKAAADEWGVPLAECSTDNGRVVHEQSGRSLGYGELAPLAAQLETPADVELKSSADYRLLGTPVARTDSAIKSNGQAQFGIDVRVDGMVYAAVKQSPVFGGKVKSVDAAAVRDKPGVIAVDEIPNGVAVIAQTYWQAQQALAELPVEFDTSETDSAGFSSDAYRDELDQHLDDSGVAAEDSGDAPAALAAAARTISADYHAPFLAHATLEPMNCTALVEEGHCTVWAPNQGVDSVVMAATEVTGLDADRITVHTPYLGGGFGRRFIMDYTVQAVTLANRRKGTPIQVIWTREEDTQHDFYRPLIAARYRAGFDDDNQPVSLHTTTAGDGPIRRHMSSPDEEMKVDPSVMEGVMHQPYAIANKRADYVYRPVAAPIGFWRSVGHSMNAFFTESFIDEMAHAAEQDPIEFRRSMLNEEPRFRKVLDTAVQMAGWKGQAWDADDGRKHAMGVALHQSFNSIVAEVAEVSISDIDEIQVHKVWCAVDCGFAVNPRIVTMQMESGIAFGLSAALLEQITVSDGKVEQANFDSYPFLPPQRMPEVEVEIVNSGADLGGIGEPGTPPIAPAVANGLFALTGKRLRDLPLRADEVTA
ncbi:isoquinoline 1-oxidoreductase beta subunit [Methylohalomonas lacus]|uniref:Isoquinoline 1-oxidoreductase beta subunit n=1 Tax=Methylohalomonas lacus TaxID=398773 RepID=A0AAE3HP50_9GAMM|nr:xanthine dehydrogenase family protein molybdopterin-binding subunit [Methylohalomonas lacus]MCS3904243.1 isoquinoline 1-oxidoreductase beta subunit [Methylohalomonas lacus]